MKVLHVAVLWMIGVSTCAYAEPPPPTQTPSKQQSGNKKKGGRVRDKEAEGTEARNRFQADPVIKSKYELNGQSLEVDPD